MFVSACLPARRVAALLVPASLFFGAAGSATAATYVTFDPANGNGTSPYDINSQGVITGAYMGGGSGVEVSAFLRAADGTITSYIVPNAVMTYGVSINDTGTIAGSYRFSDNQDHGYVRASDGTFTTFDVSGAEETTPRAINSRGAVTGYADGESSGMGFLRTSDGTITTFQAPGQTDGTYPLSINSDGDITGYYCCIVRNGENVTKGFLRHPDGSFTTYLPSDTRATWPIRIAPSRAISGFYIDTSENYHGFFRANGGITTFDVPGGSQTEPEAMSINDIITGFYYDGSRDRGFIFEIPKNKYIRFDMPGSKETYPVAINREKFVTGYYYPSSGGNFKGFLRTP